MSSERKARWSAEQLGAQAKGFEEFRFILGEVRRAEASGPLSEDARVRLIEKARAEFAGGAREPKSN